MCILRRERKQRENKDDRARTAREKSRRLSMIYRRGSEELVDHPDGPGWSCKRTRRARVKGPRLSLRLPLRGSFTALSLSLALFLFRGTDRERASYLYKYVNLDHANLRANVQ